MDPRGEPIMETLKWLWQEGKEWVVSYPGVALVLSALTIIRWVVAVVSWAL
jgi:hypothetical protein